MKTNEKNLRLRKLTFIHTCAEWLPIGRLFLCFRSSASCRKRSSKMHFVPIIIVFPSHLSATNRVSVSSSTLPSLSSTFNELQIFVLSTTKDPKLEWEFPCLRQLLFVCSFELHKGEREMFQVAWINLRMDSLFQKRNQPKSQKSIFNRKNYTKFLLLFLLRKPSKNIHTIYLNASSLLLFSAI